MMNKILTISTLLVALNVTQVHAQKKFMDYIYETQELPNLEGLVFKPTKTGTFDFTYKGKPIKKNHIKDTIPYSVINEFTSNILYKSGDNPIMLFQKSPLVVDSISQAIFALHWGKLYRKSNTKLFPMYYSNHKDITFYIVEKVGDSHKSIDLFSYDKKTNSVLSALEIYGTEIIENDTVGSVAPYYQTLEIKDNIIKQLFNDGFSDLRGRHIRIRDDGYFETVWFTLSDHDPVDLYDAVIQDSDGYVNVREYPTTQSKVYYTIPDKAKVVVTDYKAGGNWLLIRDYKDTHGDEKNGGWVHKSRLKLIEKW